MSPEEILEFQLQIDELVKGVHPDRGLELDEEVEVARFRVERAFRRGAEKAQPLHRVLAAQCYDPVPAFLDDIEGVHATDFPPERRFSAAESRGPTPDSGRDLHHARRFFSPAVCLGSDPTYMGRGLQLR